jgi:hypothetical protein
MTMFPVLTEPRRRRPCASPTERSAHGSSRTTPANSPEGWPARAASQSGSSNGLRRASASSPGCWQACRSSRSTRRRASMSSSTSSATAIRRSCSGARGAASPATRWSLAAHRRPRHPRRRCCGPPGRAGPETPALIVYTSGTTGPPNGAVLPRRAISSNLDALADAWRGPPEMSWPTPCPSSTSTDSSWASSARCGAAGAPAMSDSSAPCRLAATGGRVHNI